MQSKENIYVFLLDIITDGLTFSGENPMNPVGFAVCVYPISGSLGVCVGVGGWEEGETMLYSCVVHRWV